MFLDDDVGHLGIGKIQRERLPLLAVVERYVDAVLASRVQEARPLHILAHGVHIVVVFDPCDDLFPRLAVVVGFEDVRLPIVLQVVLDGDVGGARLMRRRVHDAHAR